MKRFSGSFMVVFCFGNSYLTFSEFLLLLLLAWLWFSCPCGSTRAVCRTTYLSSLDRFSFEVDTSVSLPDRLWGNPLGTAGKRHYFLRCEWKEIRWQTAIEDLTYRVYFEVISKFLVLNFLWMVILKPLNLWHDIYASFIRLHLAIIHCNWLWNWYLIKYYSCINQWKFFINIVSYLVKGSTLLPDLYHIFCHLTNIYTNVGLRRLQRWAWVPMLCYARAKELPFPQR